MLKQSRLFGEFDTPGKSRKLVDAVKSGDLSGASENAKSVVLAWCSRFLAGGSPSEADEILASIRSPQGELVTIARAFITAARGDALRALGDLAVLKSTKARSAAFILLLTRQGFGAASGWLQKSCLTPIDLDADGKLFYLQQSLDGGDWLGALTVAESLVEGDFLETPALFLASAEAHLVQAAPLELRSFVMDYHAFNAATFPLSVDSDALKHRRTAMRLFERMREKATSLGLMNVANLADDKALWLGLLDPEQKAQARKDLERSMRDPERFLGRLPLALQFGLGIDLEAAEREVDRQTAMSGGKSPEAALARFGLVRDARLPYPWYDNGDGHLHENERNRVRHDPQRRRRRLGLPNDRLARGEERGRDWRRG